MRLILFLVFFLSGCSSNFNIEMFNNSNFPLVVHAKNSVTINPGERKKIGFYSSIKSVKISWRGESYEYVIDMNGIPGKYFVSGWTHGVKLQVEGDLGVYIRNPEFDFSTVQALPEEQPIGFPVTPKLLRTDNSD